MDSLFTANGVVSRLNRDRCGVRKRNRRTSAGVSTDYGVHRPEHRPRRRARDARSRRDGDRRRGELVLASERAPADLQETGDSGYVRCSSTSTKTRHRATRNHRRAGSPTGYSERARGCSNGTDASRESQPGTRRSTAGPARRGGRSYLRLMASETSSSPT